MTPQIPDSRYIDRVLELLTENGFDGIATALEILFNEAMKIERSEFLQAGPYERSDDRRGYANGFKPKRVKTRVGELDLAIPQVRGVEGEGFYPKSLERGVRSERALKLAIAEMYVQGVSTRRVMEVTQQLCGLDISSTQVSRAAQLLDEELETWRTRPLGSFPYLILDARYEKVRHGGSVIDCAVLIAVGVDETGHRSILGASVSLSEAEVHWRGFLQDLQERGLHGVRLITSDAHAGLRKALTARFAGVPWQRCQFHLQQNAQAYVPRQSMKREVAADLRGIFDAADRGEADRLTSLAVKKYSDSAPKLAAWIEGNVHDGLTVLDFPRSHRVRMRTTNGVERINLEVRRRTRVATLFPHEASLLRLVSAVLMEISEDWETGRIYLNMETD
jgi:transposase-like protein